MPGMGEDSELLRNDTSSNSLNSVFSSGITTVKTNPVVCKMMPFVDNSGEESDSCSDDEGPFSPESLEDGISRFDDSEILKITPRLQSISIGSDTSAGSDDSIISGRRDLKPWNGSSSESSPRSNSYSENESSDDEEQRLQRKLDKLKRDYNANYETASKNKNYKDDKSSTSPDTRGLPKNAESDDDSSDNDSSDDDTEGEAEVVARGPMMDRVLSHNGKPYDRKSPKYEDTTEVNTPENFYQEDFTEYNFSNSNFDDVVDEFVQSKIAEIMQTNSTVLNPVLDVLIGGNECRPSSDSPTDELLDPSQTTHGQAWRGTLPEIRYNGATSPVQSPQFEFRTVHPPLSPASSSSTSDNNEHSPVSYINGNESPSADRIATDFESCQYFGSPQDASPMQLPCHETYGDMGNQLNGYIDVDIIADLAMTMQQAQGNPNICQSNYCSDLNIQSTTQVQTSPNQITNSTNFLGNTTSTQDQQIVHQISLNDLHSHPSATHLQNSILSKTSPNSTSRGIVTITAKNEVGQSMPAFGQTSAYVQPPLNNTVKCNEVQTTKSKSKVNYQQRVTSESTIANKNDFLLPSPVTDHKQLSSSQERSRNSRPLALWSLSRLPSTPATERLKKVVSVVDVQLAMHNLYDFEYDHFTQKNNNGDTYLMSIVRDQKKLSSHLAYIMPTLEKMKMIPTSLIMENQREDALYLTAINCPEFAYVTGVLAATIANSCTDDNFWERKYNEKNDTLIHVVAAQGDSHLKVLQELLAVQKTSSHTLFNLSATNSEGKTPLHLAVEAHNMTGSIEVVKLLMEYGADPVIREQKNGNTALHMAMSNKYCLGMVQALLHNNGDRAVNIANYAGNTPVHLAAGFLNKADPKTQKEVCWRLITAGGRTNITNKQNKVPLAFVAPDRRATIEEVFHKRL